MFFLLTKNKIVAHQNDPYFVSSNNNINNIDNNNDEG